jgi:hypothetical protein
MDRSRRSALIFGQDVRGIVDRLLAEQLPDGSWNCEAANGSTRSSFNTTICVLEALLAYERAGLGSQEVIVARLRGQEFLLERRLFRRRSTGEAIERDRKGSSVWTRFAFPTWWHYDVLRGLDYLRSAGVEPDERVAEAIDLVASKCDSDGLWLLEVRYPGVMPVETDQGEGLPKPMEHTARPASVELVCALFVLIDDLPSNSLLASCSSIGRSPLVIRRISADRTIRSLHRSATQILYTPKDRESSIHHGKSSVFVTAERCHRLNQLSLLPGTLEPYAGGDGSYQSLSCSCAREFSY